MSEKHAYAIGMLKSLLLGLNTRRALLLTGESFNDGKNDHIKQRIDALTNSIAVLEEDQK